MLPAVLNIHPSGLSVNWEDISWAIRDSVGIVTSKQISGISSAINLNVVEAEADITLWYQVTSSQITANQTTTPSSPWIQVASGAGTTFSVSNGQWVSFVCHGTIKVSAKQIDVKNASDSNKVIDSFTISVIE
jgi:hypothetical protein